MLKSSRKQPAAVLGALSHGDMPELDQALSANDPFAPGGQSDDAKMPRVHLPKRTIVRLAGATSLRGGVGSASSQCD